MTLQNWLVGADHMARTLERTQTPARLGERMGELALQALSGDRRELSLELQRMAWQASPGPAELLRLAQSYQASGRFEQAALCLRDLVAQSPTRWHFEALGLAEAQVGDFEAALSSFMQAAATASCATDELWYRIGSVLARLGRVSDANDIFERNIALPIADNRQTSTRTVRLVKSRTELAPSSALELPFRRRISPELGAAIRSVDKSSFDVIQFVCCDTRYFSLFSRALCRSIADNSGVRMGIHFHLVNPGQADQQLGEQLAKEFPFPVVITTEEVDFGPLSSEQKRTYYSCVRYLLAPLLLAYYGKTILITDADQMVAADLGSFFKDAQDYDVSLLEMNSNRCNILAWISASVLVANNTPNASSFLCSVRNYLLNKMCDPEAISWHLDQAALAVVRLASADVRIQHLDSNVMQSTINRDDEITGALFWSVTYSIKANSRKLTSGRMPIGSEAGRLT